MALNRQRELKQQYKQLPPAMGVYAIRNLNSGRLLLGHSPNLAGALNRARFELVQGSHRGAQLQADWRRCGAQAFCFEVVDVLKPSDQPGFDVPAELDALLALWRGELGADPSGWADVPSTYEAKAVLWPVTPVGAA